MRFKTIQRYIDAIKYDGTNKDEVCRWLASRDKYECYVGNNGSYLNIAIRYQNVVLKKGWYIYEESRGEFKVMEARYFDATWEVCDE